jgi:hypothetical protein
VEEYERTHEQTKAFHFTTSRSICCPAPRSKPMMGAYTCSRERRRTAGYSMLYAPFHTLLVGSRLSRSFRFVTWEYRPAVRWITPESFATMTEAGVGLGVKLGFPESLSI